MEVRDTIIGVGYGTERVSRTVLSVTVPAINGSTHLVTVVAVTSTERRTRWDSQVDEKTAIPEKLLADFIIVDGTDNSVTVALHFLTVL